MEIAPLAEMIQDRGWHDIPELGQAVWNAILSRYFSASKRYSLDWDVNDGVLYASALSVSKPDRSLKKIFAVGCRFGGGDQNSPDHLTKDTATLRHYLQGIPGEHRKFGAVAVEEKVAFYELVDGNLRNIGHVKGGVYMLDRQCQSVSEMLNYSHEHHSSQN